MAKDPTGATPIPLSPPLTPAVDPAQLRPAPGTGIPDDYLISVVMPVYNEARTIRQIVEQVNAVPLKKEIIAVDDCSTDGTGDGAGRTWPAKGRSGSSSTASTRARAPPCRTGLAQVSGDIVIIQDADLEYDPAEYPHAHRAHPQGAQQGGLRLALPGRRTRRCISGTSVGNKLLTLVTNVFFDTTLTDMETCYKVFTADIARRLASSPPAGASTRKSPPRSYAWATASTKCRSPIRAARCWEGKKISWKDGIAVVGTLLRYRFLK